MPAYKRSYLNVIDRVTVHEAAKRLGVSEGAVRQRIHRGKLESDRDDTGRVYVYLTPDDFGNNTFTSPVTNGIDQGLLDELRDRIRFLEDELTDRKEESRRKDTLLAQANQTLAKLASRVPELEPPPNPPTTDTSSEATESLVMDENTDPDGSVPQDGKQDSWWQRIFGG
jgi:excisionase family DNA binding protein